MAPCFVKENHNKIIYEVSPFFLDFFGKHFIKQYIMYFQCRILYILSGFIQPMFSHGLCNRYSQPTARVLHNSYSSRRRPTSRFLLISYVGRRSARPTCSDTQIHAHPMERWRGRHCMQGNNLRAARPILLQHDYVIIA